MQTAPFHLTAQELAKLEAKPVRRICAFCRAELTGSDPLSPRISHGMCEPICDPARAMGWKSAEELVEVQS